MLTASYAPAPLRLGNFPNNLHRLVQRFVLSRDANRSDGKGQVWAGPRSANKLSIPWGMVFTVNDAASDSTCWKSDALEL